MAKYLNCKTVCRLIKVLTKCKPFLFFSAYWLSIFLLVFFHFIQFYILQQDRILC
jgi:hypothetical protein